MRSPGTTMKTQAQSKINKKLENPPSAQIMCMTQWIFTKWAHLCKSSHLKGQNITSTPHKKVLTCSTPSLLLPHQGKPLSWILSSFPGGFFLVYFNHSVFQVSWGLLLKLNIFYFAGVELGLVERTHSLDKRNDWGWESWGLFSGCPRSLCQCEALPFSLSSSPRTTSPSRQRSDSSRI